VPVSRRSHGAPDGSRQGGRADPSQGARTAPSDASPDGVRWTRQQVQPMPAPAGGAR
jgi:hypothetical protein